MSVCTYPFLTQRLLPAFAAAFTALTDPVMPSECMNTLPLLERAPVVQCVSVVDEPPFEKLSFNEWQRRQEESKTEITRGTYRSMYWQQPHPDFRPPVHYQVINYT